MVKKSITVTDQQEAWIQGQLASGHYATDSELIREAIREKQLRMDEVERIRAALIAGEESGISDLTPEDIRKAVRAEFERT
ncbi:MAG: type II toxin-antitoxin system ParD family antitoxin [Rhodospirillales bacterium CG15_BIG_FIL_POST_REV_8_21_14_020_66_15]|nr:MAG: type II toxin-antitoxin system ParD family antitoxin [Rhodospirillales bacterium CG15_BIG_FIL_POST_REV_8_21_14_020_66_15]